MTIGYMIIAHRLPDQLVRLVERLDAPGVSFFIHVDKNTSDDTFHRMREPLHHRPHVHFVKRHPCYWGGYGVVAGTLECMREAMAAERPPDYAFLLSGQDYPLVSHDEILEMIERAGRRVIMRCFPLPDPRWLRGERGWVEGGMERFESWYVRIGNRTIPLPRSAHAHTGLPARWSRLVKRLGVKRRFPRGLRPFGGKANWGMPQPCIRDVLAFSDQHPRYAKFFKYVFAPDEMFFHTIVMNSKWADDVVNDILHYAVWPTGDDEDWSHPRVLTSNHLQEMMHSGKPFARKFDASVDSAVLDEIEAWAGMGRGSSPAEW